MRFIFLTILFLCFFSVTAEAATLSLRPTTDTHGSVLVDVVADTDGNAINSIDAAIQYPSDMLTFSGYQDAEGMVKVWIEQPHVVGGTIRFIGGIPGGVTQQYGTTDTTIPLVRLVFTVKKAGSADLSFTQSTLLLNDGKGSELLHTATPLHLSLSATTSASGDITPPRPFTISLIPPDTASHTPQMIAFTASDSESGIQRYEVRSGFGFWKEAQSPYIVKGGLFTRTVFVKAIDTAGNSTIERLSVPGLMPAWGAIVIVVLLGASVWYYFVIKKKV